MISDKDAQRIASYWHSPSPRDRNITALSHGRPFDKAGLIAELERDLQGFADPSGDEHDELEQLLDWARAQ